MSGLILDGMKKVGYYRFHCAEDSYGRRTLMEVKILNEYIDIAKKKSNKDLRFMLVNENKLVEDLGYGTIDFSSGFVDEAKINISEATFYKISKGLN